MSKLHTLPSGIRPATLSDAQAAAYVGVSLNKYRRMREDGLMPKPRKVDGRNLNIIAELDKALAVLPINDGGRE
ncbi:MAG: hypothetical protein ABSD90_02070 [Methylocystis sp.]|jgi:hypothetical protein